MRYKVRGYKLCRHSVDSKAASSHVGGVGVQIRVDRTSSWIKTRKLALSRTAHRLRRPTQTRLCARLHRYTRVHVGPRKLRGRSAVHKVLPRAARLGYHGARCNTALGYIFQLKKKLGAIGASPPPALEPQTWPGGAERVDTHVPAMRPPPGARTRPPACTPRGQQKQIQPLLVAAAAVAFVAAAAAARTPSCGEQLAAIAAAVPPPAGNGTLPDLSWFVVDRTWCHESNPCYTVGGVGAARDCCAWAPGQGTASPAAAAAATARPSGAGGGEDGSAATAVAGGLAQLAEGVTPDGSSSKEISMVREPVQPHCACPALRESLWDAVGR